MADGMTAEGDPALTYTWHVDELDRTTFAQSLYTSGVNVTNAFDDADINHWVPGAVTYLTRSDWQGTYPETLVLEASTDMIAALNDVKRYENGQWNDAAQRVGSQAVVYQDLTTVSPPGPPWKMW